MDLEEAIAELPEWLQEAHNSPWDTYPWWTWVHEIFPDMFLANFTDAQALRFFNNMGGADLPGNPRRSINEKGRYFLQEYRQAKREFFASMRNH